MLGYREIGYRENLIEKLEARLRGCERVLKQVYRSDMLKMYLEIEKEIEIQKCYLQIGA